MRIILLFSSLFISSAAFASNTDEARQTIKAFSSDLKQVLVSTMKQSGPLAAISVCNTAAPAIASQHSNSPWQISRSALNPVVSLKNMRERMEMTNYYKNLMPDEKRFWVHARMT